MDNSKVKINISKNNSHNNNWSIIKEYINNQDINSIVTSIESELCKQGLIKQQHTVQFYFEHLVNILILEKRHQDFYSTFVILKKIPKDLELYELFDLSIMYRENNWKNWFISLEDNLNNLRKEKQIEK